MFTEDIKELKQYYAEIRQAGLNHQILAEINLRYLPTLKRIPIIPFVNTKDFLNYLLLPLSIIGGFALVALAAGLAITVLPLISLGLLGCASVNYLSGNKTKADQYLENAKLSAFLFLGALVAIPVAALVAVVCMVLFPAILTRSAATIAHCTMSFFNNKDKTESMAHPASFNP